MGQTINRKNIQPRIDVAELQRDAMRYLKAHYFLRELYGYRGTIPRPEMSKLREQAISGDVEGATKGLGKLMYDKGYRR